MIWAIAILTLVVLALLLRPVRRRGASFDEEGDQIARYRAQVAVVQTRFDKGLLTEEEKAARLAEIEKASVARMKAIQATPYRYLRSPMTWVLVILCVAISGGVYSIFYTQQTVQTWEGAGGYFKDQVLEGLFDPVQIKSVLKNADQNQRDAYCFLLQQQMLKRFAKNPEALTNVAECHLQLGFMKQADEAVKRALRLQPDNVAANYFYANLEFLKTQRLSPKTQIKLTAIYRDHPDDVNIGYLLLLNSFVQGRFDEAAQYLAILTPYLKGHDKMAADVAEMRKVIMTSLSEPDDEDEDLDIVSLHGGHMPTAPAIGDHSAAAEGGVSAPPDHAHLKGGNAAGASNAGNGAGASNAGSANSALNGMPPDHAAIAGKAGFTADITIAPVLRADLETPKTLFIIVKSEDGQLLTAAKFTVNDVNAVLQIRIADGDPGLMAMVPMAGFKRLVVTARISQTGEVLASPGDLTSAPVTIDMPQKGPATILIDQRIK